MVPKGTVVPVLRGPLKGKKWVLHSGAHSSWVGGYEPETSNTLAALIKPGMVCYDCGANVGYFTLVMSALVGPAGQVFAFEPDPRHADALRKHMELNDCRNVVVKEIALSNCSGTTLFMSAKSMSAISQDGNVVVACDSLDRLGLPAPDVMKIDVEGAELDVLDGASRLLREHRPVVLMALHINVQQANECVATLKSFGYQAELHTQNAYEILARPHVSS